MNLVGWIRSYFSKPQELQQYIDFSHPQMKMSMQRTLLLFAVGLASFPVLAMALLIWIVNSDIRKIVLVVGIDEQ